MRAAGRDGAELAAIARHAASIEQRVEPLLQLSGGSFSVVVDDCDVELVPFAQLLVGDREPETRAGVVARPERPEDALALLRCDAGAVVVRRRATPGGLLVGLRRPVGRGVRPAASFMRAANSWGK